MSTLTNTSHIQLILTVGLLFAPILLYAQTDDSNLINITTLERLDAMRYDLDGDGVPTSTGRSAYNSAFGTSIILTDADDGDPEENDGNSATIADGSPTTTGYELRNNLDFAGTKWAEDCASGCVTGTLSDGTTTGNIGWAPIGTFTATFEGNDKKISNLYIDRSDTVGLFGNLGTDGEIRNLGIDGGSVTGSSRAGGLVGDNDGGTISACHATGNAEGLNAGGLVGNNSGEISACYATGNAKATGSSGRAGGLVGYSNGEISGCYATGTATARRNGYAGGLVGDSDGTISACYATGTATARRNGYAGGLVGDSDGTISACYATGTATARRNGYAGGLVGYNTSSGEISACHATGTATATGSSGRAGGLVGYNNGGTISACHATGNAEATGSSGRVGGLVGLNSGGTISACYATGDATGTSRVGGLVGLNSGGTISACYATGTATANSYAGGLVGYNNGGTISACYATGTATANSYAGGLVGYNNGGTISACYATGNAEATESSGRAGGLVGYNSGEISACYATGNAEATESSGRAGGLVGKNTATITDSYFDYETSGRLSSETYAKSSSELQSPTAYGSDTDIYADWNIDVDDGLSIGVDDAENQGDDTEDDPWDFGTNGQYPTLKVDFDKSGSATWQEFGDQRLTRFISTSYAFYAADYTPASTEVGTVQAIPSDYNYTLSYSILSQTLESTDVSAFSIASVDKNGINVGTISVSASPPTFTVDDVYMLEVQVSDGEGGISTTEVSIEVIVPTIIMSDGDFTACSGTFFDPGGDGDYNNSEDITMTLSPVISTDKVHIEFTSFNTESCCDKLYIYDGATIDVPLIGTYSGTTIPSAITSTSSDGKLTFRFDTNNNDVLSGWEATISCVPPSTAFKAANYVFYVVNEAVADEEIDTVYATVSNPSYTLSYSILSQTLDGSAVSVFSIASVDKNGINVGAISVSNSPPTFTVGDVYMLEIEVDDANGGTSTTEVSIEVRFPPITMSDGEVVACGGTFLDPGGDGDYDNFEDITMTLVPVISTDKIHIEFSSFDVEYHGICDYDKLSIYTMVLQVTSSALIGELLLELLFLLL